VVLLVGLSNALAGEGNTGRRYPLPQRGFFQMKVPTSWRDQHRQPSQPLPPTIAFRPGKGKPFDVLVTPIWRARADVPSPTKDTLRRQVERTIESVKSQAVEKDLTAVEFQGASGPGFYFSATDPAPKPGEYRFMTQGILRVNELTVTFTILTNDGQEQVVQDALAMLQSAVHVPQEYARYVRRTSK
jgi:hypothetical protein